MTLYKIESIPVSLSTILRFYSFLAGPMAKVQFFRRLEATVVNRVSDLRTYDAYGKLASYTAIYTPSKGKKVTLYSYTLTRDSLHRIISKSETIQNEKVTYAYSYDLAGRLIKVLKNNKAYSSYTYDDNGNRIAGSTAGVAFTASYDAQDRLLTYGPRSYTYNANGDRISQSQPPSLPEQYTYDALGNMKSLKFPDGTLANYGFDGESRNTVLSVNGVVQKRALYENALQIAALMNETGAITETYSYGTHINTPDLVFKNGVSYRMISDHLGSPRLVVRVTDGLVAQRMDYNDLGGIIKDTSPNFQAYGFAGGLNLSYGRLTKFGARYYDAGTGRWTTKDPIGFGGGDMNLFGYVANDPINFIDPEGKFPLPLILGALAGIFYATDTDTPGAAQDEMIGVPLWLLLVAGWQAVGFAKRRIPQYNTETIQTLAVVV